MSKTQKLINFLQAHPDLVELAAALVAEEVLRLAVQGEEIQTHI